MKTKLLTCLALVTTLNGCFIRSYIQSEPTALAHGEYRIPPNMVAKINKAAHQGRKATVELLDGTELTGHTLEVSAEMLQIVADGQGPMTIGLDQVEWIEVPRHRGTFDAAIGALIGAAIGGAIIAGVETQQTQTDCGCSTSDFGCQVGCAVGTGIGDGLANSVAESSAVASAVMTTAGGTAIGALMGSGDRRFMLHGQPRPTP